MAAYVYAILVDGTPRYIGKGRGKRKDAHMQAVRSIARRRAAGEAVKVSVFYDRLTAAWLGGAEVEVVYLAEGLSDEQAFALESLEIETRNGLWNVAPGGIGFRSSTAKRMWAEHREKITAAQSGGTKPGTAANLVSLWENPEYRARMSAVAKATWSDKREVMCAKRRETWANPEYRAMMEAKSQAAWTPERRAAFSKRRKAQAATPEGHAQLVEASRRSHSKE